MICCLTQWHLIDFSFLISQTSFSLVLVASSETTRSWTSPCSELLLEVVTLIVNSWFYPTSVMCSWSYLSYPFFFFAPHCDSHATRCIYTMHPCIFNKESRARKHFSCYDAGIGSHCGVTIRTGRLNIQRLTMARLAVVRSFGLCFNAKTVLLWMMNSSNTTVLNWNGLY